MRQPKEGDIVMLLPVCGIENPACYLCRDNTGVIGEVSQFLSSTMLSIRGMKSTHAREVWWPINRVEVLDNGS